MKDPDATKNDLKMLVKKISNGDKSIIFSISLFSRVTFFFSNCSSIAHATHKFIAKRITPASYTIIFAVGFVTKKKVQSSKKKLCTIVLMYQQYTYMHTINIILESFG